MPLQPLFEILHQELKKNTKTADIVFNVEPEHNQQGGIHKIIVSFKPKTREKDHRAVQTAIAGLLTPEKIREMVIKHKAKVRSQPRQIEALQRAVDRIQMKFATFATSSHLHDPLQHPTALHIELGVEQAKEKK